MKTNDASEIEGAARDAGCCRRCRLRFMGCRLPQYYIHQQDELDDTDEQECSKAKKSKVEMCACCLGLLQPQFWDFILENVNEKMKNISYDSDQFACGLSMPACIMLREHSMSVHLKESNKTVAIDDIVPFKQAWKWSFGPYMAKLIGKELDSGSIAQFLITLHMEYKSDTQELESLKKMIPEAFEERKKSHRKFRGETFTRASVESYLKKIDPILFKQHFDCPPKPPNDLITCFDVEFTHDPLYLGGRYIKFSRELPQTPWILDGKRIMENSIQEIIFKPLIDFFEIPSTLVDNQMKFISSGREDVDVRCLCEGRPFVIEILNPTVTKLTSPQLEHLELSMSGHENLLKVVKLQIVKRDSLILLKKGEDTKTKTYEALCIKISESENGGANSATVTEEDLHTINNYGNISNEVGILLKQKTPIRVLHRRPLLTRPRKVLNMKARFVEGKPNMFSLTLTTEAGTYIKEFIHGDFGRTSPNLSQILGAKVDILALDVKSIDMDWP